MLHASSQVRFRVYGKSSPGLSPKMKTEVLQKALEASRNIKAPFKSNVCKEKEKKSKKRRKKPHMAQYMPKIVLPQFDIPSHPKSLCENILPAIASYS